MGGATVFRERESLFDLDKLVYAELHKAEKVGLYLRYIELKACDNTAILFDVTMRFSK